MVKKKQSKRELEEKALDLENKWKRALADYSNLEKRVKKERVALARLASAGVIDKLLPVLDELEICQKHLKDKGLQISLEKFKEVLKSEGVKEMKIKGQEFDPRSMDAVEITKGPKNKVVEVMVKGYELDGEILRPAKVKVGQGSKK